MRESAWSSYEEPCYVHGPADGGMIYFGSASGWSPAREKQKEIGCRNCGGIVVYNLSDPDSAIDLPFQYDALMHALVVPEDDPLNKQSGICPSCMRWARDNKLALMMQAEFDRRGTNDPIEVLEPAKPVGQAV